MSSSVPPPPSLLSYETVRLSSVVQFSKQDVFAYLTSHRVLLVSVKESKLLFSIPTSIIKGHNVSAASSAQIMMRIAYQAPQQTETKYVVLVFTSREDRQTWKDATQQVQHLNMSSSAPNTEQRQASPTIKQEHVDNEAKDTIETGTPAPIPPITPAPSTVTSRTASPSPSPSPSPASSFPTSSSSPSASTPPSSVSPSVSLASSASAVRSASPPIVTSTISLSTLECRASLLARHPHLKQLHTELVVTRILSEEEFWSSPQQAQLIRREQEQQQQSAQSTGIPSQMTTDITPTLTTANSIHFKLDKTIIHNIFLHSPAVHQAYQQLVPDKMTEKEFWTKYFRSRYVHAARNAANSTDDSKTNKSSPTTTSAGSPSEEADSFKAALDDAEKNIEVSGTEGGTTGSASLKDKRTKVLIAQKHVDPSVDLTSADADDAVTTGQPSVFDYDHSVSEQPHNGIKMSKKARAQMELVKKYNRHGILLVDHVLDTRHQAANLAAVASAPLQARMKEEEKYQHDLADSLTLTDLQQPTQPQYHQLPIESTGFFQEIGKRTAKTTHTTKADTALRQAALQKFSTEVRTLSQQPLVFPSASLSASILIEVSRSSRAMNRAARATKQISERQQIVGTLDTTDNADPASPLSSSTSSSSSPSSSLPTPMLFSTADGKDLPIPTEFQTHLTKHFLTIQELCRHFYSCFPFQPRFTQKLERVKAALDAAYKGVLLFREYLNKQQQSALIVMLDPLLKSIEQCDLYYNRHKNKQEQLAKQRGGGGGGQQQMHTQQMLQPGTGDVPAKRIKVG